MRIPNKQRTETTRQALAESARTLFVERGYAATSTPDICDAAGITRGALYHHFTDKRDLFRFVVAIEAQAVAEEIRRATASPLPPDEALALGTRTYLRAMTAPGRTRLLLVEGPAVLGIEEVNAIDAANAAATLREGLVEALPDRSDGFLDMLSRLMAAACDRAALEIDHGADPAATGEALLWMMQQLHRP